MDLVELDVPRISSAASCCSKALERGARVRRSRGPRRTRVVGDRPSSARCKRCSRVQMHANGIWYTNVAPHARPYSLDERSPHKAWHRLLTETPQGDWSTGGYNRWHEYASFG